MVRMHTQKQIGRKLVERRTRKAAGISGKFVIQTQVKPLTMTVQREAHNRLVDSIMGKYADVPGGSEEFAREKQEETEREERALGWITGFTEWAESHCDLPPVPASVFSREADYEDRD